MVRPNSPVQITSVSSSNPRCFKSISNPAVALEALKEGEANVKEVSTAVLAEVKRIETDPRFQGMTLVTLFNQGEVIDEALSTLFNSGMIGGGIAYHTAIMIAGARHFLAEFLSGQWTLVPWILPSAIGFPAAALLVRRYAGERPESKTV